jgi:putative transposase
LPRGSSAFPELRYTIPAKGQRTRVVTIATTLLDPMRYPKQEITALYGVRWTVETHFAELKTTHRHPWTRI